MLGLGTLLDRRPRELSGGERQRVAMGRAIVRAARRCSSSTSRSRTSTPRCAPSCASRSRALVRTLGVDRDLRHPRSGRGHDLGDRIAVMRGGELQQVGPPRAIYEEPANDFVAGFLGAPRDEPRSRSSASRRAARRGARAPALRSRVAACPSAGLRGVGRERVRVARGARIRTTRIRRSRDGPRAGAAEVERASSCRAARRRDARAPRRRGHARRARDAPASTRPARGAAVPRLPRSARAPVVRRGVGRAAPRSAS